MPASFACLMLEAAFGSGCPVDWKARTIANSTPCSFKQAQWEIGEETSTPVVARLIRINVEIMKRELTTAILCEVTCSRLLRGFSSCDFRPTKKPSSVPLLRPPTWSNAFTIVAATRTTQPPTAGRCMFIIQAFQFSYFCEVSRPPEESSSFTLVSRQLALQAVETVEPRLLVYVPLFADILIVKGPCSSSLRIL